MPGRQGFETLAEPEGKEDRRNENKNLSGCRERNQGKSRPAIPETKKTKGKGRHGS